MFNQQVVNEERSEVGGRLGIENGCQDRLNFFHLGLIGDVNNLLVVQEEREHQRGVVARDDFLSDQLV